MKKVIGILGMVVLLAGCPAKTAGTATDGGQDVAVQVTDAGVAQFAPQVGPPAPLVCQPDAGVAVTATDASAAPAACGPAPASK